MICRILKSYKSWTDYGRAGAPGGAGGFLNGAPQPVANAPHIAASSTMLINLFFIAYVFL